MHDYEHDVAELLQQAVDEDLVDVKSDGYGVAKQYIHEGYSSLSERQKFAFERDVSPGLKEIAERNDVQWRISGMHD